ncbi:MAG: hypothetical protein Q9181_007155, partial [Wetmoreana brouardii]
LYHASPKSIHNVALSSKYFRHLTYKYLYRKIRLTFARYRNGRNRLLLEKLLSDSTTSSLVHEVYINWLAGANPRHETEEGKQLTEQLIVLIPRLVNLKKLIFDAQCAISKRLLFTAVHYDSKYQLYTICPYRSDVNRSLQSLQDCSQLVALDVTIGDSQILAMKELRKVLAICPNLLKLSVASVSDNAIRGGQALVEPGMRLPNLKFLRIRGVMQLANYNLPGWEQCSGWESLEYLESTDSVFLQYFSPSLKELRSLTLFFRLFDAILDENALINLMCRLPKLEHLSITGSTRLVLESDVLKHKGSSLKTLQLHEDPNDVVWTHPRSLPDEGTIRRLGKTCPRLTTCAIDLNAGHDWPWKLLSVIAESLWFIVHLELDIFLNVPRGQLQVTLASVREIWNFLWNNIGRVRKERGHASSLPRLRTLKISTSDSSEYIARFEARLTERDNLAVEGHVEVVSLELEGLHEKYGYGECENNFQEDFRRRLTTRAERGPSQDKQMISDYIVHPQARPLETTLTRMVDW